MTNAETYTVLFNLNYTTNQQAPQPISVEKDKEMALAQKPIPQRDGCRFAGWYKGPACTQEWEPIGRYEPDYEYADDLQSRKLLVVT